MKTLLSVTHKNQKKMNFFQEAPRRSRKNPTEEEEKTSKLDTEVLLSIEFSVSHYYSFLASDLTLR